MNKNKSYISTFKFKWCKCPSHSKRTASVSRLPVKPSEYYKELIKKLADLRALNVNHDVVADRWF